MQQPGNSSWKSVLAAPARASHILQLHDSDEFLAAAVAYFAAEGLRAGEAVHLTGTRDHLAAIERALGAAGVDAAAAVRNGQLCATDVREALAGVTADGRLDGPRFEARAAATLERALGDPRFAGLRWWGEITNTLFAAGDRAGGFAAEHVADAAAKRYGVSVLCPFLCDRFDPRRYDEVLRDLCCIHSHVIPAEDYVAHRLAVNRAVAEVIGDFRAATLQSLASWKGFGCDLPSSQALLFWLRDTRPDQFAEVLERARRYHAQEAAAS